MAMLLSYSICWILLAYLRFVWISQTRQAISRSARRRVPNSSVCGSERNYGSNLKCSTILPTNCRSLKVKGMVLKCFWSSSTSDMFRCPSDFVVFKAAWKCIWLRLYRGCCLAELADPIKQYQTKVWTCFGFLHAFWTFLHALCLNSLAGTSTSFWDRRIESFCDLCVNLRSVSSQDEAWQVSRRPWSFCLERLDGRSRRDDSQPSQAGHNHGCWWSRKRERRRWWKNCKQDGLDGHGNPIAESRGVCWEICAICCATPWHDADGARSCTPGALCLWSQAWGTGDTKFPLESWAGKVAETGHESPPSTHGSPRKTKLDLDMKIMKCVRTGGVDFKLESFRTYWSYWVFLCLYVYSFLSFPEMEINESRLGLRSKPGHFCPLWQADIQKLFKR